MRSLLKIWLFILAGAGIGVVLSRDSGYVLLSAGNYTVEMSLALLLMLQLLQPILLQLRLAQHRPYLRPLVPRPRRRRRRWGRGRNGKTRDGMAHVEMTVNGAPVSGEVEGPLTSLPVLGSL